MRVKGFLPKRPFLCGINAAVAIDQKCHQADRKKCKPFFHTKYFHSDQNRCAKYWLHFPPPRIQVPRRPSLAVLPHFPPQNQGILNGGNWIFLFFDDFPGSYIPLGHIAWFLDDMSQPSICRDICEFSFLICPSSSI